MNKPRPVNLNLFTIRFPLPAIISILHRISGVLTFLFIPFVLWVLHLSLVSPAQFMALADILANPLLKLIIWIFLAGLFFHLLAGIRHLIMDLGIGEELSGARLGARLVIILTVLLVVIAGVWLW